ncbi:Bug family tripartite tricarboxylate transporter substrate binding protein [Cronobacter dublinensis]|uniref:Bug family tripartite tricarboxylate transporter substrate binding protein n=1 Tax=Cronobacter dublinensis TaxID=413497 RepID=UPI0013757C68|nr:tripartite tricarboxylate transporter substrate binding protein [Cronobacter dublinensis]EKY3088154.1 tripartite tricarboxylate transporter substrate binding protein [Cronobacter dublinensis]ELQ6229946.1 tripartite tricarboxylate transporter substrate binding protein [Cronobacter dublinensis]ELY4004828.1 tripartite tricarboxylate transporter substrate binding protein [Cronobacter dublinensis]ELY4409984.1 tripartite tricarboxylate transporter substrate binding protein [Cronobacter dublinensis
MKTSLLSTLLATSLAFTLTTAHAAEAPSRPECIAPAKPGGGFDLTCKLIQVSLQETGALEKPMRVTYMPGGVGAVAYNAIVAQRPGEPGTVVAFSGGSLLNLSQGKFGRYNVDDVRWLASVGTDYGMIAVRADSPWKTLGDLMKALEKDPNSVVFGAGASIGSQDWMKTALLAQKAGVDPHKMRYVAFEGGGEPVTALMGNHVQAVSGDLSEMVPYLTGNKLRVLAVFANERLPGQLAQVPTAKEQGYDLVWPIIRGFYVGPKVSDADYQWWVRTFEKLQQTGEFKKQRDLRGLFEFNLTGKALDEYVKNQVNDYREKAKAFGLAK